MLVLVVDTNLFHEFHSLETLPWGDLTEADEIILLVPDPVQTELDEQKKSPKARVKRRALDWVKRFREMLKADETDLVLREDNPRVILRLDDTRPSKEYEELLDLTVPDDAIVAIAVSHSGTGVYEKVRVFSDDLRPMRKARQVGLEFMEVPDAWRREPELTDDDKEKQRLREEIAKLKRQEPDLALSCSSNSPVEFVLPVYEPMSGDQLEELMQAWLERHPIETNFERAKESFLATDMYALSFGMSRREFRPAAESDIEKYREVLYPEWLATCHDRLSKAHEIYSYIEQRLELFFELQNRGTRPADDLQITFMAKGGVGIMPTPVGPADEDEEEPQLYISFDLPPPPEAPQGKWEILDPLRSFFGKSFGGADPFMRPHIGTMLHDLHRNTQRDPNLFYYKERPLEPVSSYSLTCSQFRHASGVEGFEVSVRPNGEDIQILDGKTALIEVVCNASNLSTFEPLRLVLKLKVEVKSTYEILRKKFGRNPFVFSGKILGTEE